MEDKTRFEVSKARTPKMVFEFIVRLEQDYELFERTIAGVHFWPLIRFELYLQICRLLDLFSGEDKGTLWVSTGAISGFIRKLSSITTLPILLAEVSRYCVVPHMRRQEQDGAWLDNHTSWLDATAFGENPIILDPSQANRITSDFGAKYYRINYLLNLSYRLSTLGKNRGPAFDRQFFGTLESKIHQEFDVEISLRSMAVEAVIKFKSARRLYRYLFRRLRTREVFLVVAYYRHAIVAAAHDVGAIVHEVQHGAISPFHVGYSFPNRPKVPYFPDTLLTFGPFWSEQLELPSGSRVVVAGTNAVPRITMKSKMVERKQQVVFLSQWSIGAQLVPVALDLAKSLPNFQIIYRLHPQENERIAINRLPKNLTHQHPNFRLSTSSEDLWDILLESDVQIGVYSTALFEGMFCGCRTVVLRLSGWEQMKVAIARGDAILVETEEDLVSAVSSAPKARAPENYFTPIAQDIVEKLHPYNN